MGRGGIDLATAFVNQSGIDELAFRHVEVDAELRAELAHQVNEVADSEGGAAVETVVEEQRAFFRVDKRIALRENGFA